MTRESRVPDHAQVSACFLKHRMASIQDYSAQAPGVDARFHDSFFLYHMAACCLPVLSKIESLWLCTGDEH